MYSYRTCTVKYMDMYLPSRPHPRAHARTSILLPHRPSARYCTACTTRTSRTLKARSGSVRTRVRFVLYVMQDIMCSSHVCGSRVSEDTAWACLRLARVRRLCLPPNSLHTSRLSESLRRAAAVAWANASAWRWQREGRRLPCEERRASTRWVWCTPTWRALRRWSRSGWLGREVAARGLCSFWEASEPASGRHAAPPPWTFGVRRA